MNNKIRRQKKFINFQIFIRILVSVSTYCANTYTNKTFLVVKRSLAHEIVKLEEFILKKIH